MKYSTSDVLKDWQNKPEEIEALTKHAPSKTAKKQTLADILNSVNAERLMGCKVKKVDGMKYFTSTTKPTSLVSGLVDAMGDNIVSLPEFLTDFYPNVLQRTDFVDSLKLGLTNIVDLDAVTAGRHIPKHPTPVQRLYYVMGRDDFRRDDKRVLSDVTRALSIALFNQVTGQPLVKSAGRGLYLNRQVIRQCMARPTEASDEQISNALVLLRLAGLLHLAQDDELTEAGKKLSYSHDKAGKPVKSFHIFVVGNFGNVDWELFSRNFKLDLHTTIGKTLLTEVLGLYNVETYFPDLIGGVSETTIDFMVTKANESASNTPIMSLKAARDTAQAIEDVASSTAGKYIDQTLVLKKVKATKMSTSEALDNGYNLDEWKSGSPAEKLILPTSEDSLRMCIERLKRANKKGIKVSQLLDD